MKYSGAFLCKSILNCQGILLTKVLQMDYELPLDFYSGDCSYFLKGIKGNNERDSVENECSSIPKKTNESSQKYGASVGGVFDDTTEFMELIHSSGNLNNNLSFGLAMVLSESFACVISKRSFTPDIDKRRNGAIKNTGKYYSNVEFYQAPVLPFSTSIELITFLNHDIPRSNIALYMRSLNTHDFLQDPGNCKRDNFNLTPNITTETLSKDIRKSLSKNSRTEKNTCHQSNVRHKTEHSLQSFLVYSYCAEGDSKKIIDIDEKECRSNEKLVENNSPKQKKCNNSIEVLKQDGNLCQNKFAQVYFFRNKCLDGNQGQEALLYSSPMYPMYSESRIWVHGHNDDEGSCLPDKTSSLPVEKPKRYLENLGKHIENETFIIAKKQKTSEDMPSVTTDLMGNVCDSSPLHLPCALPSNMPLEGSTDFPDPNLGSKLADDLKFIENETDLVGSASSLLDADFMNEFELKTESNDKEEHIFNKTSTAIDLGVRNNSKTTIPQHQDMYNWKHPTQIHTYSPWVDLFEPLSPLSHLNFFDSYDVEYASRLSSGNFNVSTIGAIILYVNVDRRMDRFETSFTQKTPTATHSYSVHEPFKVNSINSGKSAIGIENIQSDLSNGLYYGLEKYAPNVTSKRKRKSQQEKIQSGYESVFFDSRDLLSHGNTKGIRNVSNYPIYESLRIDDVTFFLEGLPSIRLCNYLSDQLLAYSGSTMFKNVIDTSTKDYTDTAMVISRKANEKSISNVREEFSSKSKIISRSSYFGPFNISYIQQFAPNFNKLTKPRIRDGIGLPMGVKIPQHSKDATDGSNPLSISHNEEWTDDESKYLIKYANGFGSNWHVVSHAITYNHGGGISINSACHDRALRCSAIRSARQCREKYESLPDDLKLSPESEDEFQNKDIPYYSPSLKSQINLRPENILSLSSSGDTSNNNTPSKFEINTSIILDPKNTIPSIRKRKYDLDRNTHIKEAFKRLKKSSTKRQCITLTIPGVNTGSKEISIQQPSHPSHAQSVQAAVAQSAGSSGLIPKRPEMWPLQFLDLAEKQKNCIISGGSNRLQSNQNQDGIHSTQQSQEINRSQNLIQLSEKQQELVKHGSRPSRQSQGSGSLTNGVQSMPSGKKMSDIIQTPGYNRSINSAQQR
eukprot:CAMPEP_0184869828 /NCGR_PEP_ID=MMETSP0580-20130426/35444_1 /TAXON_ID=1118495 /ORGANISM="Dactyliosolen fragilissimus" /LENGTH=1131 /DNA_ID=CAMNT_0027371567 /DNA_START=896 /DNA_END=4291 /DNA_ORIENTATION=-